MSSERDRFDDRRDEGSGWQEPAHLGGGGTGDEPTPPADRPEEPARGWEPPGWSLPPAEPQRPQSPVQPPSPSVRVAQP